MSKSELSDLSRINLTDDKDEMIYKIKKAKLFYIISNKEELIKDQKLKISNLLKL